MSLLEYFQQAAQYIAFCPFISITSLTMEGPLVVNNAVETRYLTCPSMDFHVHMDIPTLPTRFEHATAVYIHSEAEDHNADYVNLAFVLLESLPSMHHRRVGVLL
jgi:hypothetical protein